MIQSFINTTTSLASNSASVVFQKDCIRTNSCCGCRSWLCHNEGSANYDIVNGGIYKVSFNATISSATSTIHNLLGITGIGTLGAVGALITKNKLAN